MRYFVLLMAVFVLLVPTAVAADPSNPASGPGAALIEYTLPVAPTNILLDDNGVWFTSYYQEGLGYLDLTTGSGLFYAFTGRGWLYGVRRDPTGRIWYGTTGEAQSQDSIGAFDPRTAEAREWTLPRNHFGLNVDSSSGKVWFVSKGLEEGEIGRLNPVSNEVTTWTTTPYTDTYDLNVDPGGQVWFTVQPRGLQGFGRLSGDTGRVDVWTMPSASSRPYRILAVAQDEIWLSEFGAPGFISRFRPSADRLEQYPVPPAASSPGAFLKVGDQVWFAADQGNSIVRLDLAGATPVVSRLTKTVFTAPAETRTLVPTVVRPGAIKFGVTVNTTRIAAEHYGPFTVYTLPRPNSRPFALESSDGAARLWFTTLNVAEIGVLVPPKSVFLPAITR